MFITSTGAVILVYPPVSARARRWAQQTLFRRGDFTRVVASIRALDAESETSYLEQAAGLIAEFVSAKHWRLLEASDAPPLWSAEILGRPPLDRFDIAENPWALAAAPLRVSSDQARTLLLGSREGGRRYLSEDLADLDRLAAEVAGRLETLRSEEQRRLLAEAELETLRRKSTRISCSTRSMRSTGSFRAPPPMRVER